MKSPVAGMVFGLAAAGLSLALPWFASTVEACELRQLPVKEFGSKCTVVVGYANGEKVGPFKLHWGGPGGASTKVGTCDGYVPVESVAGDVVKTQAYSSPSGPVKPHAYTLSNDCRSIAVQQY